jgi:glycosyltransferase involved in cell wall biosynthesis
LNIILVTDGIYPFTMGGIQKHSAMLLKQLLLLNHRVMLVTFCGKDAFGKTELLTALNLPAHCSGLLTLKVVPFPITFDFPGHYVFESYLFSKHVYKAVNEQISAFDFVYCQGFTGWYLLKKKSRHYIPVGINFHGLNMFQPSFGLRNKLQNWMFRPFVLWNLRAADVVFSLGGVLTKILVEKGVKRERIIEQHNGIDETWLTGDLVWANNTIPQFLFVGRNDRVKGLNEIIRVIEALPFPVQLNIVGQEGISTKRVKYHGVINEESMLRKIYEQNDTLIMNSYSEGMPTVILEAMAVGRPVISSNVGAIEALVDHTNGRLFTAGDSGALKDAVHWFVALPADQKRLLGENSRRKIKAQFIWRNIVESSFRGLDSKK